MRLAGITITAMALGLAGGCLFEEDRHIGYHRDRTIIGPVELKDRIVDDLLFGELVKGGRVCVDRDEGGLTFEVHARS